MSNRTSPTNFPEQPYVLNWTETVIPINIAPAGEKPHWTEHRLRRARREELLERERASTTETKPKAGGEVEIITNDRAANIDLHGLIVLGVKGLTQDGRELTPQDALFERVESGWRNKAVQGLEARSTKLRWDPSMAFIDSDQRNVLYVVQEFGIKELPDFVVVWKINKPDEITMADFRLNAQKISTGGGGRRAKTKLITDLTVAERVFREIFAGVEGAVLAVPKPGGSDELEYITYSADRRDEFIGSIDLTIQRDVVQCVMDYLEGQLQD